MATLLNYDLTQHALAAPTVKHEGPDPDYLEFFKQIKDTVPDDVEGLCLRHCCIADVCL
jgi:hypothetical protein